MTFIPRSFPSCSSCPTEPRTCHLCLPPLSATSLPPLSAASLQPPQPPQPQPLCLCHHHHHQPTCFSPAPSLSLFSPNAIPTQVSMSTATSLLFALLPDQKTPGLLFSPRRPILPALRPASKNDVPEQPLATASDIMAALTTKTPMTVTIIQQTSTATNAVAERIVSYCKKKKSPDAGSKSKTKPLVVRNPKLKCTVLCHAARVSPAHNAPFSRQASLCLFRHRPCVLLPSGHVRQNQSTLNSSGQKKNLKQAQRRAASVRIRDDRRTDTDCQHHPCLPQPLPNALFFFLPVASL